MKIEIILGFTHLIIFIVWILLLLFSDWDALD